VTETRELLEALIRIDSVNPVLDPAHPGEAEIARFVRDWADARGLATRWLEPVPGRPSVIVRAEGRGGGRTLMLNAHLDTVGVTGMDAPFEPRLVGGRLHGRGAMDMKGSLAACLAVAAWAAGRDDLAGDVVVTAVADEEHDSLGTRAALAEERADLAVVTEPTDLALHVAHRGFALVEVELEGRASHTSQPERGVNALRQLGRLLAAMDARDAALRARPAHALLGHGSWQPVLAAGGHELFTTPAHAEVTLERRTLPGEDAARGAQAEVEEVLAALGRDDPSLRARARTTVAREAFDAGDPAPAADALAEAARAVTGREPARLGAPYWTDAALVAEAGVPTVLFGPVGGGIHQPDEWVDAASVEVVREVLQALAQRVCG
jgi:acetylornithine deacetylase